MSKEDYEREIGSDSKYFGATIELYRIAKHRDVELWEIIVALLFLPFVGCMQLLEIPFRVKIWRILGTK